jgi:hypothetical protein
MALSPHLSVIEGEYRFTRPTSETTYYPRLEGLADLDRLLVSAGSC